MRSNRRGMLDKCAVVEDGLFRDDAAPDQHNRKFHLTLSEDALDKDPELLHIVQNAGITDIWLIGFLYGHWHFSLDRIRHWQEQVHGLGMNAHILNVPLGHPAYERPVLQPGDVCVVPPEFWRPPDHWKSGTTVEGKTFYGVGVHPPATAENVRAIQQIKTLNARMVFLDDDFRLTALPRDIGGCFCDWHRQRFLEQYGHTPRQWDELLEAVTTRSLTPVLNDWVDFICNELTDSFRAQQRAAAPEMELGIMVMFLGSEKAGIRLDDYHDVPFRVGELMYNDDRFKPAKGKTDELFSSLFHRRFIQPHRAYSESTAYPPDRLSAANMAAKLCVSTLSDVRNTMFMSCCEAFPSTHWDLLGPAMKKHVSLHRQVAGHQPRGPLKHYWGRASRWVGNADPYSLFLALGVPFEVSDEPATDGWTFLSDADARSAAAGNLCSPGTQFVHRPHSDVIIAEAQTVPESLDDLFALKRKIIAELDAVPYVRQDVPVICAWYPTARAVLLWNLTEQKQELTLHYGAKNYDIVIDKLDLELLKDI